MKRLISIFFISIFLFSTFLYSKEIKGVNLPEKLTINKTECVLNGAGVRKKFFFSIYVIGLYLPEKMTNAEKIINLEKDKGVLMVFTFHKISPKKIQNAWTEGFEKNVKDLSSLKSKIDKFNTFFNQEVKKGDKFLITYSPEYGTCVKINNDKKGCIKGEDFMRGLFSIWLGTHPINKGLKNKLLGK